MSNVVENGLKSWRIVFFGSADFSLPALKSLVNGPDEVVLVVSPAAAPSGRGRKLAQTPVAIFAQENNLPLLETASFKDAQIVEAIEATRPDILVVAAYRGFLPPRLLELGLHPPLNIHPSLLPRHRGAAPVNWSLIHGDDHVGVSIIFLEEEMDAGPILSQVEVPIAGHEKAGELEQHLAEVGAVELMKVIIGLKESCIIPQPQEEHKVTINPLLCKRDGDIDWHKSACELVRRINGVDPWPGAQTFLNGKLVKMFGAVLDDARERGHPGEVLGLDDHQRLVIGTGRGAIAITELQPEGKKRMSAADFFRGYHPVCFTCG